MDSASCAINNSASMEENTYDSFEPSDFNLKKNGPIIFHLIFHYLRFIGHAVAFTNNANIN